MAREFNGSSDHILFTLSSVLQPLVAGPLTMVVIMNLLDTTDGAMMHTRTSGGTNSWWMEISGGAWNYGQGVAPRALVVPSAATGWAMYKGGKDAGGAAFAEGRRVTMPGGTVSTATAASGLADGTPPGSGGVFEFGKWGTASEYLRARVAAAAIFGTHITNTTQLDSYAVSYANLKSGNGAGAPLWCVHFNQASATDPITDDTGNGGNSATITGTTIVANPSGVGGGAYFGGSIVANLGILSETDSMQAMGRRRIFALGALQETGTVQPVGRLHVRATGVLQETDTVQPVGRRHARATGVLQVTDTIQPAGRRHSRTLGVLATTEVELPLSRLKRRTLGLLAETDSLLSVGRARSKILGLLQETSTTQQMGRRHTRTLGVLTEVNSLLGLDLPIVPEIDIDDELIVRSGPSVTTVTTASTTLTVRTGSSDIVVMTSE